MPLLYSPNAKPGPVGPLYTSQPRDIFYGGYPGWNQWIQAPVTIDGTLTSCPTNSPYVYQVLAGMPMGRVTATKKYANSILGLTTSAAISGATTVQTDPATAVELVRRIGASGTFTLTGPPAASGVVAAQTVTYSSVNTSNGAITCTATSAAAVIGSLIQPTDGSQTILTVLCDINGIKVTDQTNVTRIDVFSPRLLAGGPCTINQGSLISFPTDPSLINYVEAAIVSGCPGVTFLNDFTG